MSLENLKIREVQKKFRSWLYMNYSKIFPQVIKWRQKKQLDDVT
jgi:hypothetical protein